MGYLMAQRTVSMTFYSRHHADILLDDNQFFKSMGSLFDSGLLLKTNVQNICKPFN